MIFFVYGYNFVWPLLFSIVYREEVCLLRTIDCCGLVCCKSSCKKAGGDTIVSAFFIVTLVMAANIWQARKDMSTTVYW